MAQGIIYRSQYPIAPIVRHLADGWVRPYGAGYTSLTDVNRGALLVEAVGEMVVGERLQLGGGTFDIVNAVLGFPDDVVVEGVSAAATLIYASDAPLVTSSGTVLQFADRGVVRDLSVDTSAVTSRATAPIGCMAEGAVQTPFTRLLAESCRFLGASDAVYLRDNGSISSLVDATFRSCLIQSNWDAVAVFGPWLLLNLTLDGCRVVSSAPYQPMTSADGIKCTGGVVRVRGGQISATGDASHNGRAIDVSGGVVILESGTHLVSAAAGGTSYDIYAGGGEIRANDAVYDVAKVSGKGYFLDTGSTRVARKVTANPKDATPANRPPASYGEVVIYATDGDLYVCNSSTTPTFEEITSA